MDDFTEKRVPGSERRKIPNPMRGMERRRAPAPAHVKAVKDLKFFEKGQAKPAALRPITQELNATEVTRTATPRSGPAFTYDAKESRVADRRSPTSSGANMRSGFDRRADPKLTDRDLRVSATGGGTASGRGTIVSAPVQRRAASRAARTIGSEASILKKLPGRLGKLATAGLAAYGVYRAWKGE